MLANEIQKYLIYVSIHTPESINARILQLRVLLDKLALPTILTHFYYKKKYSSSIKLVVLISIPLIFIINSLVLADDR